MAPKKKRPPLTRLELEILQVLWGDQGDSFTVRDVLEGVNRGRKPPLAYTTVQTVLTILKDKGVVSVQPGPGRAHVFRALVSQQDVSSTMVSDLVNRLFAGRVQPLLQRLIEDEALSSGELKELKEWIETRLDDAPEESR
jgi:BlaI family transcriptional regulator, penicillinase repressor